MILGQELCNVFVRPVNAGLSYKLLFSVRQSNTLNIYILKNTMSFLRLAVRASVLPRLVSSIPRQLQQSQFVLRAGYSSAAGLSRDAIEARVLDVLKGFETIDATKVGPSAY